MLQDNLTRKIILWINYLEELIVTILLSSILVFSVSQIILRNFFDYGIVWGESLIRILVLWLGMAGAIMASHHGKQINIDVLSQFVSESKKTYINKINYIFASSICLLISYHSYLFVRLEYETGNYAFQQIPAWIAESIIPVSFAVMGIRYFIQFITDNNKS